MPGISVWDDDKEFESIAFEITNDKVKKLVKSIEKNIDKSKNKGFKRDLYYIIMITELLKHNNFNC